VPSIVLSEDSEDKLCADDSPALSENMNWVCVLAPCNQRWNRVILHTPTLFSSPSLPTAPYYLIVSSGRIFSPPSLSLSLSLPPSFYVDTTSKVSQSQLEKVLYLWTRAIFRCCRRLVTCRSFRPIHRQHYCAKQPLSDNSKCALPGLHSPRRLPYFKRRLTRW